VIIVFPNGVKIYHTPHSKSWTVADTDDQVLARVMTGKLETFCRRCSLPISENTRREIAAYEKRKGLA